MTTSTLATQGAQPLQGAGATLPSLLVERVAATPDGVALRHKRLGIWNSVTWAELAARVEAVAAGLDDLGVSQSDVVVIVSDNRPEWVVLELAAQSLRAAVVGPHPECTGEELLNVLRVTGAVALAVEDHRQLDKLAAATSAELDVPVIGLDVSRLQGSSRVLSLGELESRGAELLRSGWWRERVAAGSRSDVAVLCLPSRASAAVEQLADPSPVPLTHAGLCAASTAFCSLSTPSAALRYVSVLPFGWSWEQVAGLTSALRHGFPLCLAEGPATQRSDLREIGPDVLLLPARAWEGMAAELESAAADAGRLGQAALRWAGKQSGATRRLADLLVLRTVRDRVGLSLLDRGWSFGEPLRRDVADYFASIGVDLRPLYGAEAAGGPVAAQRSRADEVPGGAGGPLPGVDVELAADGELLVRSASIPLSLLGDDGRLHTGDRARIVDSEIVIVDRLEDVVVIDGEAVGLSAVAAQLRTSRYVEDAVVLPAPKQQQGVVALLVLDGQALSAWTEQQRLHASSYEAATQLPEVEGLVRAELAAAAAALPSGCAVRRCVLLPRRLDPQLGEVTRMLVVRRRVVLAHFPAHAAALGLTRAGRDVTPVRVLDLAAVTA